MKLLLLSTALAGLAVTISATRGPVSAGPVTAPNWGTPSVPPPGPPSGAVTIVATRSTLQVAPDSVGFTVDLTGADFDTPAPATQTEYDQQFHKLEYFWTFGDPGTWTAPEKTLSAWKNRNFAYGPFVRHMFRAAGTYSVTCFIVEPSSGKTATATLDVVVADPNTVFPTTRTICVNPVGDADFSAKPTGALTFNQNSLVTGDTLHTAIYNTSGLTGQDRVRVLFKAGWTGTVRCDLTSMRSVSFGTYGGSAKAVWNVDEATAVAGVAPYEIHACIYRGGNIPDTVIPDQRFQNIRLQGTFDETIHRLMDIPVKTYGFNLAAALRYFVVDCEFDGLTGQAFGYTLVVHANNPSGKAFVHLDNCAITSPGYYTLFATGTGKHDNGTEFALTGCRVVRDPDALTEFDQGQRALFRCSAMGKLHIRGNDMHNSDGVQGCLRLADADIDGLPRIVIHTNALESVGNWILQLTQVVTSRPAPDTGLSTLMNALIEGNIIVGGWRTMNLISLQAAGVSIRNNLCVMQNAQRWSEAFFRFIDLNNKGPNPDILGWPTTAYNNTFVCLRSQSGNNGNVPDTLTPRVNDVLSTLANVGATMANNVVHMPSLNTPQVAYAPLSTDVLFASRNEGFRPVYHEITATLATAVPNGGTVAVAYDGAAAYQVANWSEHNLTIGGTTRTFTLSYGTSTVTITNTSGVEWASGAALRLRLYNAFGHYRPKQTAYASGNVLAFAPLTGSAALGAALSEPSSERSILGQVRPSYPSMGAWEMP